MNAGKLIGGHVKSITSPFSNRITFCTAVTCRTFRQINLQNFKVKFQAVAEKKQQKTLGGYYYILPHPVGHK